MKKFDFLPEFDCVYSFEKNERDLAELDEEKKLNMGNSQKKRQSLTTMKIIKKIIHFIISFIIQVT